MAMAAARKPLTILRQLIRELKGVRDKGEDVRQTQMYKYIFDQYRKYQITDEKLCKGQKETVYLAETYLTYLQSLREYEAIYEKYHSKGEISVEAAANMVGLRLPNLYEDPSDKKE